jgi:hypothetical protein
MASAAARYGLDTWGLPLDVEEIILENLSRLLIKDAKTNLERMKLMDEIISNYNCDYLDKNYIINIPNYNFIIEDNIFNIQLQSAVSLPMITFNHINIAVENLISS